MKGETKGPWAIGESAEDMKAWLCVRDADGWSRAYCADASVAAHIVACVNAAGVANLIADRADALAQENAKLLADNQQFRDEVVRLSKLSLENAQLKSDVDFITFDRDQWREENARLREALTLALNSMQLNAAELRLRGKLNDGYNRAAAEVERNVAVARAALAGKGE